MFQCSLRREPGAVLRCLCQTLVITEQFAPLFPEAAQPVLRQDDAGAGIGESGGVMELVVFSGGWQGTMIRGTP